MERHGQGMVQGYELGRVFGEQQQAVVLGTARFPFGHLPGLTPPGS